jgi:hypothetical protein
MQSHNPKVGPSLTSSQPQDSFAQAEPWPTAVNGAALLNDLTEIIRRHVVLEPGGAEAVALWTVHTHALDAFAMRQKMRRSDIN